MLAINKDEGGNVMERLDHLRSKFLPQLAEFLETEKDIVKVLEYVDKLSEDIEKEIKCKPRKEVWQIWKRNCEECESGICYKNCVRMHWCDGTTTESCSPRWFCLE